MSDLVQLGRQFRRRRQELGATQVDVARTVGVTRQWLVRVEGGTGNPDLRQLLRLCEVLDVSLTVAPRLGLRDVAGAPPGQRARARSTASAPARTTRRAGTGPAAGPATGLTTDLDRLLGRHTGQDS